MIDLFNDRSDVGPGLQHREFPFSVSVSFTKSVSIHYKKSLQLHKTTYFIYVCVVSCATY